MVDQTIPDFRERAEAWLNSSDTGMSSKAIFHFMTLGVRQGATPLDGSDLGRCIRLLDQFPEWRARMPEMATVSEDWAILIPHWDRIVSLYHDDLAGKTENASGDAIRDLFYENMGRFWIRRPSPTPSSEVRHG